MSPTDGASSVDAAPFCLQPSPQQRDLPSRSLSFRPLVDHLPRPIPHHLPRGDSGDRRCREASFCLLFPQAASNRPSAVSIAKRSGFCHCKIVPAGVAWSVAPTKATTDDQSGFALPAGHPADFIPRKTSCSCLCLSRGTTSAPLYFFSCWPQRLFHLGRSSRHRRWRCQRRKRQRPKR